MPTYYVSSIDGNDSYDGSAPSFEGGSVGPKLTIAAAKALITADNCILRFVGGSTFTDQQFQLVDYNNTTYEAYGAGNKPILKIATQIAAGDWGGPDGNGCYTVAAAACFWLIEDGHALKKGSGVTLPEGNGTWFYTGGTIYYKPSGGGVPGTRAEKVQGAAGSGAAIYVTGNGNISNTVIDGLEIKYGLILIDGFYLSRNYLPFTLKNCSLTEVMQSAFDIRHNNGAATGLTIQGNTFTACFNNIYMEALSGGYYQSPQIINNTIAKSNLLYDGTTPWMTDAGDYDGLSIQSTKDAVIEGNDISGKCVNSEGNCAAINIWQPTGLTTTGNIIRKNFIHSVQGYGVFYGGESAAGETSVQVDTNIILNALGRAIGLDRSQNTVTRGKVLNNTIYNCLAGIYLVENANYFDLQNNLVVECDDAVTGTWGANNTANHNAYHNSGTYITGETPITADPLLANEGGSLATNYQLQSGSPCINAGTPVGLTTDYGSFSIVGNPDIGAWEVSGKIYSKGDYLSLPTNAAVLETYYTGTEVTYVATNDDTTYVSQTGSSQYAIHEFKNDATGKSSCMVTWDGQTNLGNSEDYPTFLEIYNTITEAWEELTRDTTAAAGIDFKLEFPILSGLDNYKDANGIITCRVYQSSIAR